MVTYICSKCNKSFDRKNNYEYHINRKFSCVPQNTKLEKTGENLSIILDLLKYQNTKIELLEKKIEQLLIINNITS